jgi:hypothetical protein
MDNEKCNTMLTTIYVQFVLLESTKTTDAKMDCSTQQQLSKSQSACHQNVDYNNTNKKIEIKRNNKPPMQHLQATIFARLSHLKNFQFTIKRGEISKGPGIVEGNSSNPNSCDRCHMTAATILLYVSNFSYQG